LRVRHFGRHAVIFDELEAIELLRTAVDHERGQSEFAGRHSFYRVQVNRLLKGRKVNVTNPIAKALGLWKLFVAE
jgi:hypothetical protein